PRDPMTVGELHPLPFEQNELVEGDEIVSIGGVTLPPVSDATAYADAFASIPLDQPLPYEVNRGGEVVSVDGPYVMPSLVKQVMPQSAAYEAGLKSGDVITAVDGAEIFAFRQLKTAVEASEGTPLELDIWRDGETLDITLRPKVTDEPQP
ncbi:MAG TPA: RIP metalloprotease RseP, partial [Sulfitobacter pontiacus]|nr:RIP metalloprotease RseP [Sulfitobacter pontiacus]